MDELLQPIETYLSPALKKTIRPDNVIEYSNIRPQTQSPKENERLSMQLSKSLYQQSINEYNYKMQWRNNILNMLRSGRITSANANAAFKAAGLDKIEAPKMPDFLKPHWQERIGKWEKYHSPKGKEMEGVFTGLDENNMPQYQGAVEIAKEPKDPQDLLNQLRDDAGKEAGEIFKNMENIDKKETYTNLRDTAYQKLLTNAARRGAVSPEVYSIENNIKNPNPPESYLKSPRQNVSGNPDRAQKVDDTLASQFLSDPNMKEKKLGKLTDNGYEVLEKGKVIGYYTW